MALGKLEREEVIKHLLEAEKIVQSARKDWYKQADVSNAFENIIHALKRIAGAMD